MRGEFFPAARMVSLCVALALAVFPGHAGATWETRPLPYFVLHYQIQDQRVAERIAEHADAIYRQITGDVGYTPPRKIFVYLCSTPECFRQQQPQPEKLPDWAVGVAYPDLNRIVLRSALTLEEQGIIIKPLEIFKHEFAHIVLEQALQKRGGAPRWLSEGFSMYQAKQWTIHGQHTMEEVALREIFIPLAVLTTAFPADEQAARIAYAQSFSLVAFMLNAYGRPIFHKFIENLRDGMDTNSALEYSAGVSLARLELEWQAALKKQSSWVFYLIRIGVFWFLLSLGFIAAYLIKRYRTQKIQAAWEREEYIVIPSEENDEDDCC